MFLHNFEDYTDSKILKRGRDYYLSSHIVSLEYTGYEWAADVEGTEDYNVTVKLSEENEILEAFCDCPYDMGEYCKHQAAVFFALRDKGEQLSAESRAKKPVKKEKLEVLLEKLDKKTLISLIAEYAEVYETMKSEIKFRFAQNEDIEKSARQVIRSAINAVKHRGYVEYRNVSAATEGAETVLRMVEDKTAAGELLTAVSLAIIIAAEMTDLLSYCDDSNGHVGGAISNAIREMSDAVLAMPRNHSDSQKIFDAILVHALSNVYDDWTDCRFDLFFALVPLCYDKENRKRLENALSSGDYPHIEFEIIRKFDGEAATELYIEQNLDNSSFRRMAINNAFSKGQYEKVIALCVEGEKNNDSYPGLIKDFKKLRYKAYEAIGNRVEQKSLALEMLLDGDFNFFMEYKKLNTADEWLDALEYIFEKTENDSPWGVYVKIIAHEKHKPRLLAYCEKNAGEVVKYYEELLPEYQQRVGQLFEEYIRKQADNASGRGHYQEVCRLIKICDKACKFTASEMRVEIAAKYNRRPAFMDELRKIN